MFNTTKTIVYGYADQRNLKGQNQLLYAANQAYLYTFEIFTTFQLPIFLHAEIKNEYSIKRTNATNSKDIKLIQVDNGVLMKIYLSDEKEITVDLIKAAAEPRLIIKQNNTILISPSSLSVTFIDKLFNKEIEYNLTDYSQHQEAADTITLLQHSLEYTELEIDSLKEKQKHSDKIITNYAATIDEYAAILAEKEAEINYLKCQLNCKNIKTRHRLEKNIRNASEK